MVHGLHSTIHYWYMRIGIAIVGGPSSAWTTHPGPLTRTLVPHHLHTPIVGFAMGQDPRSQVGDPPPSPTEARRSRASNHPPARPHSIDARSATLRGPPSSPEPSRPTASSPHLDSRRLLAFWLKRLYESPLKVPLLEELVDSSEELSEPSQPIP